MNTEIQIFNHMRDSILALIQNLTLLRDADFGSIVNPATLYYGLELYKTLKTNGKEEAA